MNLNSPRLYSLPELRKKVTWEEQSPRPSVQILTYPKGLMYTTIKGIHLIFEQNEDIETNFNLGYSFQVQTDRGQYTLCATEKSTCTFNRGPLTVMHPALNYEKWTNANAEVQKRFRREHSHSFAAMKTWYYENILQQPSQISDDMGTLTKHEKMLIYHAMDQDSPLTNKLFPVRRAQPALTRKMSRYMFPRTQIRRRVSSRPLHTRFITYLETSF